jgi:pimeloyl-ACP methyl ester carboxylesterase
MADTHAFRHRLVTAGGAPVHVVEAGDPGAPPFLFLHGWPESWSAWQPVMELAAGQARAVALDLPGIGRSAGHPAGGSKRELAAVVHELAGRLGLEGLTLVGQDVGGMIAYAYARAFPGLARAVIMDVVVPGVPPWEEVLRNPYIWHFAFHAIPGLPERLVQGHQAEYFDFFFDVLAADAGRITPAMRAASAQAYAADDALAAGFGWYRAFAQDAADNARSGPDVTAPVLYLRGEHESGRLADYVSGLRAAGLTRLSSGLVPGAGHFSQEEAPAATWRLIADFAAL